MRADRLDGRTRLHPAAGLRRETVARRHHPPLAHRLPQHGGRDDARHVGCGTVARHLLQLHHVHGRLVRRLNHPHPELPS